MTFLLPGTKPETTPRGLKEDRAYEEAKAARHARKERDKALAWEKAVKQVTVWTPAMAVESMKRMPLAVQQMYVLAEETNLNRQEVLRFFPAAAPSTREAWAGLATPQATPAAPRKQRKTSA